MDYLVVESIVYAYLPMECANVGTHLEIEFFGEQADQGTKRLLAEVR